MSPVSGRALGAGALGGEPVGARLAPSLAPFPSSPNRAAPREDFICSLSKGKLRGPGAPSRLPSRLAKVTQDWNEVLYERCLGDSRHLPESPTAPGTVLSASSSLTRPVLTRLDEMLIYRLGN